MNFNKHSNLEGRHAFLSASKYHWINYSDEKLESSYKNFKAATLGTKYHEFAAECISLKIKLPKTKQTLNMYINDAIGFKMTPEQTLYYSENCFGTADAISFKKNTLRVHDLKTGVSPASPTQLRIYCALFCLEYDMKPSKINFECRIYQNDAVIIDMPNPNDIQQIMNKIVAFDILVDKLNGG